MASCNTDELKKAQNRGFLHGILITVGVILFLLLLLGANALINMK